MTTNRYGLRQNKNRVASDDTVLNMVTQLIIGKQSEP